jgi:branched-chain amino acid transport system substrate-binding protein
MVHRKLAARTLAAGALALSLGIAACGGDDDEGGGDAGGGQERQNTSFELMIGDLVPLTGDLSVFGEPGQAAADLAVEQINQAAQQAGVQTQVSVEHADTETTEQAAVQAARQLTGGGATCLAGAWASANTLAVANSLAIRQRTPLISPASTSAEITELDDNGFVWRTAPSDNLQAQALADTIEQELGGVPAVLVGEGGAVHGRSGALRPRAAQLQLGGRADRGRRARRLRDHRLPGDLHPDGRGPRAHG